VKTSILSALALLSASTSAFAAPVAAPSFVLHVLSCNAVNAGPDHGLHLSLDSYHPSTVGQPSYSSLRATLTEQSFVGPRLIRTVSNVRAMPKPMDARIPGRPTVYLGTDFELTVNFTSAQHPSGGSYGHVTFEAKGQRYSEELICHRVR
jgi:hypothetical protein